MKGAATTQSPVRVLHVIPGLEAGGAEGQLLALGPFIEQRGVEQFVVSMTPGGVLRPSYESTFGSVQDLGMARGAVSPKAVLQFHHLLRRMRPDVIHAWMYHACLLSAVTPTEAPIVWGIRHGLDAPEHLRPLTRFIVRAMPALGFRARTIVFNSSVSRRQHEEWRYPRRKSAVIPNGVDTERFAPDEACRRARRQEWGVPEDYRVVGYLGRLHLVKGWDLFCGAAAWLRAIRRDIMFVMAGPASPPEEVALRGMLDQFGITSDVRFVGFEADVPRYLAALDVLVAPSRSEGFPNAVVEAMACGVPCVTTDVGDNAAIVRDVGVIVGQEAESIGRGIQLLLNLDAAALSAKVATARERVTQEFGMTATSNVLAAIYRRLHAGPRP